MENPLKPSGDLTLNTSHPRYSRLANYFLFGDDNDTVRDLVNPDNTITFSGNFITDPDLGRCAVFDGDQQTLLVDDGQGGTTPLTMDFTDGRSTVIIVAKMVGVAKNSGPDWKLFYAQPNSAERYDVEWYVHREINPRIEWGNSLANFTTPDTTDTTEVEAIRAFGWSVMDGTQTAYIDGDTDAAPGLPITGGDTDTMGTDAGSIAVEVLPASFLSGVTGEYRVAVIAVLNDFSPEATLISDVLNAYLFVEGDPIFGILSTVPETPTSLVPGDSLVLNVQNVAGDMVTGATIEGQALGIVSQSISGGSGTVTFAIPDPVVFGNRQLSYGEYLQIEITDNDGETDTTSIVIVPDTGVWFVDIVNPWNDPDSIVYDLIDLVSAGDSYEFKWTSGGNGQEPPASGDITGLDLPAGTHTFTIALYQDYDGDGQREWNPGGRITRNIVKGEVAFALSSVSVNVSGNTATLVFNDVAYYTSATLTLTMTDGTVNGTYTGGDGTNTFQFALDRTVLSSAFESGTATLLVPTDGIENSAGDDAPSVSGVPVVNNSGAGNNTPTVTAPADLALEFANGAAGLPKSNAAYAAWLAAGIGTDPEDGTITVTADDSALSDPIGVGEYDITFSGTDSGGLSASDIATLTVTEAAAGNDAPVSSGNFSTQTVIVGQTVNFPTAGNFSDPGDSLTYTATGLPSGSSIDDETGIVTLVGNAEGGATITVIATDTVGQFATALLPVNFVVQTDLTDIDLDRVRMDRATAVNYDIEQIVPRASDNAAKIHFSISDEDGVLSDLNTGGITRTILFLKSANRGVDLLYDTTNGADLSWSNDGVLTMKLGSEDSLVEGLWLTAIRIYDAGHTQGQWVAHERAPGKLYIRVV